MSDPLADRLDVTLKDTTAAKLATAACKKAAKNKEPHWTSDTLKLFVMDKASNTMVPVGHAPGVSGSFEVGGVTFTITDGLITDIT